MTDRPGDRGPRPRAGGLLSDEEVVRRLGGEARLAVDGVVRTRTRTTRRGLVLDTATLLGGVAFMLLAAQLLGPTGPLASSATDLPDGSPRVALGSLGDQPTFRPIDTLGPLVNPGIGFGATPGVTLPPTGPSPTPRATPQPTPRPTAKPTPTPTAPATAPPTAPPTVSPSVPVTPPPPPAVSVTCDAPIGLQVTCHGTVANVQDGSEGWDMQGSGTIDGGGDGTTSITFTYDQSNAYTVTLTVTGLDGSTASGTADVVV